MRQPPKERLRAANRGLPRAPQLDSRAVVWWNWLVSLRNVNEKLLSGRVR